MTPHLSASGLLLIRGGDDTSTLIEGEEVAYLARQARVFSNRRILVRYQLIDPTHDGLYPCDVDGSRLEQGSGIEKAAILAVRKIMLGDVLLEKDWMDDAVQGVEVGMEDPLIWVRTDARKSPSIKVAIMRRSEFDTEKHTLGLWRNSLKASAAASTPAKSKAKSTTKSGQPKITKDKPNPMANKEAKGIAKRVTKKKLQLETPKIATRNSSQTVRTTTPPTVEADASHVDTTNMMDISEPREEKPQPSTVATRKSSRTAKATSATAFEVAPHQGDTMNLMEVSHLMERKSKGLGRRTTSKGLKVAKPKTSQSVHTPVFQPLVDGVTYDDAMDISEPTNEKPKLLMRFTKGAGGGWSVGRVNHDDAMDITELSKDKPKLLMRFKKGEGGAWSVNMVEK